MFGKKEKELKKGTNPNVVGGTVVGNYKTVNKLFEEEKFHSRQGHGFTAERANNLYDKLTGKNAFIVGDNNAKNGADRIADGIEIQSKYCASGSRCINECFENGGKGKFRYYTRNGTPMQVEVPSDKYDSAIQAMEEKIRRGQIKGIENFDEAKNIVKKGHFTYEQAKNLAKSGTIESLTYDAVNGFVIASSSFGVSAVITFAISIWGGDTMEAALKKATYSGIKVGGTAFLTSVFVSQLSKMGLNSALVGSSEALIGMMGPKASAVLVNAFRTSGNIYGAAAMKSAAKLLRGNVITGGVTIVALSGADIVNVFRGRISGKQLFKNFAGTTATVAGGTAGWIGGAAAGSVIPVVGNLAGGFIGALVAGWGAKKAADSVLDKFIEDDAERMVSIIEEELKEMAINYLLNAEELDRVVDCLQKELSGERLKDMFMSTDHDFYAKNLLYPIIENEVRKRKLIKIPSAKIWKNQMIELLEELSDAAV